jgi:hypothetical protein
MRRIVLFPVLLGFAVLLAAAYGALHNQISYTVAPGYFHEFKFRTFYIPSELQNRFGAALVGVRASWWMGVILAVPVYAAALFVRGDRAFVRTFLQAAVLVVAITLLAGLGALGWAMISIRAETLPFWMEGRPVSDPVSFARAGTMHNHSYLGGLIGAGCGVVYALVRAVLSRRA